MCGRYRVLELLGRGGMGEVYKAFDTILLRHVALKFISPDTTYDAEAIERFRREALSASTLNHPNICTVYELGECESRQFIAMEFLDGESLLRRLRRGPIPVRTLLVLAQQAAEGIAAAHAQNIVHRDIKPANLFITHGDRLKIVDFGLAKTHRSPRSIAEDSTRPPNPESTPAGVVVGTLPYMSPEQARGETVDHRTDLFSLGAVIFEMAARRRAFDGSKPADIHAAVLKDDPVLPLSIDPIVRAGLGPILDKALEKQQDFRYQHADDLAADLRRMQRDLAHGRIAVEPLAKRRVPPHGPIRLVFQDLIRAATVAALVLTAYALIEQSPSGKYLDQFQLSVLQANLTHGPLDEADFEAGGRHLPLVVDLAQLHPSKRQPTDRNVLNAVIDALRRLRASAIGIDLSFDDVAPTDFQFFHNWAQQGNVRLGIFRRAAEPRDAWLGRPEFAGLAAGIALPYDNPQEAFAYTRRWSLKGPLDDDDRAHPRDCTGDERHNCKEDLYQLPVALWLASRQTGRATGDPTRVGGAETRIAGLIDQTRSIRSDSSDENVLELASYAIDYSYLKEIRRDILTLTGGSGNRPDDIVDQLAAQRGRIEDRFVLVGDLEDTSDQFCNTTKSNPLPGVLVHACALATWNRGMLRQARSSVRDTTVWVLAGLVPALIACLRLGRRASMRLRHLSHQQLETIVFTLAAMLTVVATLWLARTSGFVWPSAFWMAAGLLVYAVSGQALSAAAALFRVLRGTARTSDVVVQGG